MRILTLLFLFLLASVIPLSSLAYAQQADLVVQLGHTRPINSVKYSPDGKTLASGSSDKTIKIWDVATGELLRTLEGHTSIVSSVSYSPDGKSLASGSDDKTIKIWDVATGKLLRTLEGHTDGVDSVSYSPNGKALASGSEDETIKIWDVATGKLLRTLQGHTRAVLSVSYSPDGKTLASGSADSDAKIWDVATGKLIRTLEGHTSMVLGVLYSPDGKTLASGSYDKIVKIWNVATGKLLHTLEGHTDNVYSVSYSPDGKTLASASDDKTVKIWSVGSGKLLYTLEGNTGNVSSVSYSPDGKSLASAGWDKTIKIWDAVTGKLLRNFEGYSGAINTVHYSPDGKTLASGNSDKTIKIWDVATGKLLCTLEGHTRAVNSVGYSPDSKSLASGSDDKTIKIWDVATGKLLHTLEGHTGYVLSVSYSPDGKTLASGNAVGTIRIWDAATGKLLRTLEGHTDEVLNVSYSPDGKSLASGGWDKSIKIWDAATGKLLHTLEGHTDSIYSVSYSPDGKTIASASWDKSIKIWNVATGNLLRTLGAHAGNIVSVNYSPDGKTLTSGSFDNTIKTWDATTGELLHTLLGNTNAVNSVVYSPDGKTLASGSNDTSVRLWNARTGQPLLTAYSFEGGGSAVLDSQGRFDGTDEGLEQLHYVVGLEPVDLSQLKERYYQPNLWAKVMGTEPDPTLRDVAQFDEVKLYPEVTLTPPTPGDTKLTVTLTRRSGGYGKVEVKVANTNIAPDARPRGLDPDAPTQSFQVDLATAHISPGQKVPIEVVAWNQGEDVHSRGIILESFVMPGQKQVRKPRFYAIVVGTSRYANTSLNLRFAAKDAADFARALDLASPPELFESKQIRLLTTDATDPAQQPTKTNIAAAFVAVAKDAQEDDVVVLYFSGHGIGLVRDNKNFYCYPTRDALSASLDSFKDETLLSGTTVNTTDLNDWLTGPNRIKAQKRVLILDTCAAGAFVQDQPLADQKDVGTDIVLALDKLRDNTGYHVLMGCAATAQSYEANRYAQGLLTYSLLKYMKFDGRADGREVDVDRLFRAAATGAHDLATLNHLTQQPRIMAGEGNTFPIGLLEDAQRQQVPLAGEKPVLLRPAFTNSARHFDSLKLSGAVQERLQEICSTDSRGDKTPVYVNVDWDDYAEGVQPSGDYRIEGDTVTVQLVLVHGGQESAPLTITGPAAQDKRDQLVNAIVEAILKAN